MDWLKGMNNVVAYIEENLTRQIQYETLSQIVGCSVYEFSRIFSFLAGMSVSEYILKNLSANYFSTNYQRSECNEF